MQFSNTLTRISQLIVDVLQTAPAPLTRWVLKSPGQGTNTLQAYTGDPLETAPALLEVFVNLGEGFLALTPPVGWGASQDAIIELSSGTALAGGGVGISGDSIRLTQGSSTIQGDTDEWTITGLVARLISQSGNASVTVRDTGGFAFLDLIARVGTFIFGSITYTFNAAGFKINTGGTPILELAFGTWTGNTNASGQIPGIAHGMGAAPVAIALNQLSGSGLGRVRATGLGASTFDVTVNRTDTGAAFAAGSPFSGTWIAIR